MRDSEPLPTMTSSRTSRRRPRRRAAVVAFRAAVPRPAHGKASIGGAYLDIAAAELTKQIAAATGTIEHKSEVARGGPVAAVMRTTGCMKDTAGACKVNADVVIYKPDGSVFHEVKSLDLTAGRGAVPLKIDANTATGIYRVVVTIRDLTARRFATVEQRFGVK